MEHWSDCAVHNEPAHPVGECDCGGCDYAAWDKYYAATGWIPTINTNLEGYVD